MCVRCAVSWLNGADMTGLELLSGFSCLGRRLVLGGLMTLGLSLTVFLIGRGDPRDAVDLSLLAIMPSSAAGGGVVIWTGRTKAYR